MADDLLGIDRDISLSGVQVEMAKYLGGDVDRQSTVEGLSGEDPPEVVRGKSQPRAVDVDDVRPFHELREQLPHPVRGHHLQTVLRDALE